MKALKLAATFYLSFNLLSINLGEVYALTEKLKDTPAPIKFDEYRRIRTKSERNRLQRLVKKLQPTRKNSKNYTFIYSTSHIFIYGRSQRETRKHATKIKNFLVNERGIDENRLKFITELCSPEVKVEIWIIPPGAPSPSPSYETIDCPIY